MLLLDAIDGFAAFDAAAAFAPILGLLGLLVLVVAAAALQIGPMTLLRMRTGVIEPEVAGAVVAEHLDIDDIVRGYKPGIQNRTGKVRMAEAVRRLGKPVSELADSNATSFDKNFLSAEVIAERLVIRCWGVTGQALVPTLEDCISIPLTRGE